MKMKLFAAAVAALAAGGAYAQSSVTLYGVADVGIEYNNHSGPNGQNLYRMSSGNQSGSRWGLRGVEDLGGGLKGVFVLESGFNLDTGTSGQGSRLFGRNAYVGLQSQYGSILLGRQQTSMYDFGLIYDPMAISTRYGITSIAPEMAFRADNTVKYVGTFGGLTANAFYSFQKDNAEVAGANVFGREFGGLLSYAAGPFGVGLLYDESNMGAAGVNQAPKVRRASVAGTYAFGPAKVFAGYRWAKGYNGASPVYNANNTFGLGVGAAGSTANLYWAGLAYQLTPAFSLTGAAYYQDFRSSGADPWQFVLTGDYALSKRTDLYATASFVKNKNNSALSVGDGYGSAFVQPGKNQIGGVVGVRHKF